MGVGESRIFTNGTVSEFVGLKLCRLSDCCEGDDDEQESDRDSKLIRIHFKLSKLFYLVIK